MKRLPLLALLLLGTLGVLAAPTTPVQADLPPIIDRALIFGDPEISGAQVSPDGRHISFIKPYQDVRNVWVKKLDEPFNAARPVTADKQPVGAYFWSEDGKYVLYAQDKGGNENFHVYAVDPTSAADAATGVPAARDLTPVENVRAIIYSVPDKRPDIIIVGLNDRDPVYHDVYQVNIATGDRTLLIKNTQKVGFWIYDRSGNVRLAFRQKDDGGNEVLRVDGDRLTQIYETTYLESGTPAGFDPGDKRVYMITNKGDDVDLARLELMDPATGKTEVIESDPEKQVDLADLAFDEATHELMATVYIGDRVRVYPKTERAKKDLERMKKQLPDGDFSMGSSTKDMRYSLVSVSSDVEPGATYLYDRQKGTFTLQYKVREKLPRESLAAMKPIRYQARDGLTIPAYLTLPKGVPAKNLPVIIHPHGGPWARDTWGYDPYAQFLANRGYAVFQPNFRSSSGYGKKFLNAGNKQWGTGAMQHDLTDGVKYLVDQGIADPKRVAIYGGSYGGYATLAGVVFTPELYACAVPYVAPSSLITLIESFPAYWRPFLKGTWYLRVGDPEIAEDRKDLEARSPIHYIDRINVPLLVVHGANDPRVTKPESDAIVIALRDKGRAVEYIVAPDEGHGFRAPDNRMALAVAMEKFFAKHLGGRAQQDVPADLAAHLASITVDPATVKLAKGPSAELMAQAKTGPLPKADGAKITPGTLEYGMKLAVAGRTMDLGLRRTIEEGTTSEKRACWRLTDAVTMGPNTMTSVFDVDRKMLTPLRYEATGTQSMKLVFTDELITGELPGPAPVNKTLEAPVLGSDAAFETALAGMPLAEGYEATFRTFEPSAQKVRLMWLRVTGREQVTVKAGQFETLVVQIEPLDGDEAGKGTVHVRKDAPHQVIKSEYKMGASMGGGVINSELTSMAGAMVGSR
jgi:dipeptidyl aminopeptidase/acylaminoacyl peptidase